MQLGIARETLAGETRVAATPETVKKYIQAGHEVFVASNAGAAASYTDDQYSKAGATLIDSQEVFAKQLVLKVRRPDTTELGLMKSGHILIGMLDPFDADG